MTKRADSGHSKPYASPWSNRPAVKVHPEAKRAKLCRCDHPNPISDESDPAIPEVRCLSCGREVG